MTPGRFHFERFCLDPHDRQLKHDDRAIELNARYLDALILLVREQGRLVTKDRFLQEVWRGVPVTDEALTQCIKTLRRQLGDSASNPRFIETAPKHGYRFIAQAVWTEGQAAAAMATVVQADRETAAASPWRRFLLLGGAGAAGGAAAGLYGGLFYGFAGASRTLEPGVGGSSVLLVLVCLTMLLGVIGGAAVGFGIGAAGFAPSRRGPWSVLGGAAGGLVVGAVVKLIGMDAFNLLFGQSPGDMTGAPEGALLGGAVALGLWLGSRGPDTRAISRSMAASGLAGGVAGVLINLWGGRLLGGSLDLLAQGFPASRLRLGQVGELFGETGFGPISQIVTGGLEGAVFGACVAGIIVIARRSLGPERDA